MHQRPGNYPKLQIHEKAVPTTEMVFGPWKLSGAQKRDPDFGESQRGRELT
jgi:hypothetical protein